MISELKQILKLFGNEFEADVWSECEMNWKQMYSKLEVNFKRIWNELKSMKWIYNYYVLNEWNRNEFIWN